jgi:hypothetical protein
VTFPDYNLPWIVLTDASEVAWGAVLIQVAKGGEYECIALGSGKWTDSAKRWDIEKKEACAIVMAFKKMSYLVTGKFVIIETDNKNLLFMETAQFPIITRWRIYLQGFHTTLRHILAKFNKASDWLTRQYCLFRAYTHYDNYTGEYPTHPSEFKSTLYNLHDNKAADIDQFFTAVLNILVGGPETSSSSEVLFELDTPLTPLDLL